MHPRTPASSPPASASALVLVTAGPAAAHVTPTPSEVPADGFTAVTLTVGHGCEGSPTTKLEIQVPEGINDVTPQIVPGWNIEIDTEEPPEPITDAHGNELTERESIVTYIAEPGNELQDGFREQFGLGFKAPDTPGETLYFKTVQICEVGETAWIEEFDGEGEEPEHPAPAGGRGRGPARRRRADDDDDGRRGRRRRCPRPTDDDSDSSTGIAVAGLVAGALGLLAGGAALARSRKTPAS